MNPVYTFRVSSCFGENGEVDIVDGEENTTAKDAAKKSKKRGSRTSQTRKSKKAKLEQRDESMNSEEPQQHEEAENGSLDEVKPINNDDAVSESVNVKNAEPTSESDSKNDKRVMRTRKKAAPRLFRKKA